MSFGVMSFGGKSFGVVR